jgi:hypothetical protein
VYRAFKGKFPWPKFVATKHLNDCKKLDYDLDEDGKQHKDEQGRFVRRSPSIKPSVMMMNLDEDQSPCYYVYFTHGPCRYHHEKGGCPANHNITKDQWIWLLM